MLKKSLVLGIFLLSLSGMAMAQTTTREDRNSFDVALDFGASKTSIETTLSPAWPRLFVPAGGTMEIDESGSTQFAFAFRLGYSRVLFGNDRWGGLLRLPISYQVLGYSAGSHLNKQGLARTTLTWWDPVTVSDVVVSHKTPRVGIEYVKGRFSMAISAQHYAISTREFEGVDCQGCRNSSKVFLTNEVESGISPRIEFFFGGIALFVEKMGNKTTQAGITVRIRSGDL